MWNNVARESEWDRAERELYTDAVAPTDREINDSVFYEGEDENGRSQNRSIVNELSQTEDWEGNDVPDDELIRETTGEIPAGMAGMVPTRAADALMAENRQLRQHIAGIQQNPPWPPRSHLFLNPYRWRETRMEAVPQGRLPRAPKYGQTPTTQTRV